jgi:penicillin-binding protein 1C
VTRVLKWIASTASALILLAGLVWLESPAAPAFAAVRAAYRPSDGALVDRHGEVLQEVRLDPSIRRLAWIPLAQVSPALVEAVIHAEDRRFYAHGGIDVRALVAAAGAWIRGGRTRGASTLTMQLATLFDRDRLARTHPRSVIKKLRQLRFALALESSWSKPEILEAYLNLVDFRGELKGVGAASALLYGKAPHGLDAAQAVVLASLLPSPNAAVEAVRARARALAAAIPGASDGLDHALAEALAKPRDRDARIALAPHAALRLRSRFAGGRFVGSTLDAAVQRVAVDALRRQLLAIQERHASDGAALVVDNASGDILAYVGSSGSLSSARHVDGIRSPRQAGSALKPFLYGLAFDERLLSPASLLEDEPLEVPAVNGVYRPENYDERFHGLVSVRNALGASLNVPAVRTVLVVGVDRFAAELRDLGFARIVEDGEFYGPALALGSVEVTLWEMVAAYRAIAAGGMWSPIRLVPDGSAAPSRRVLSPAAAFLVTSILADRDARTATFGLESPLGTPFWSAVKTGTSKDMRDNWCIGFSRRYTVGVWVGNFSGEPMRDVTGVSGAAPAWLEILSALETDGSGEAGGPPVVAGVVSRAVRFPRDVEPSRREWFLDGTEPSRESPWKTARRARIVAPAAGSVLAEDPDIPPARQRVAFESLGARGAFWRLDGRELGTVDGPLLWQPRPGRHQLALVDERQNELDRVEFTVRGGN